MITRDQLVALASVEEPPAVSIYLPTHEKGREIRQDPIRLKNALAAVTERLVDGGRRRTDVERLLEPARALVEDGWFWRHQGRGLAVFIAPGLFQVHKLPIPVAEMEVFAPRPHVKPLLPLLADDGRFYCLTASAGGSRLYAGSRFSLIELDVDLPGGVGGIVDETDYQNMQHAAPQARPHAGAAVGMPASHTFGEAPEELRKTELIEHLRRLRKALADALGGSQVPVVLIAAPEVEGHLRALATDVPFVEERLQVYPGALDEAAIHARAYTVVRPLFARSRTEALDQFRELVGSGDARGATRLAPIVGAARHGRIHTLFVAADETVWGRQDPLTETVRVEPEQTPENWDLLDDVAVQTLLHGGRVHVLGRDEMPAGDPIAALLRY
jgi:hypothetical protein